MYIFNRPPLSLTHLPLLNAGVRCEKKTEWLGKLQLMIGPDYLTF